MFVLLFEVMDAGMVVIVLEVLYKHLRCICQPRDLPIDRSLKRDIDVVCGILWIPNMAILIFQADCLRCATHASPCLICMSVFFQNLKLMIVGCVSATNFVRYFSSYRYHLKSYQPIYIRFIACPKLVDAGRTRVASKNRAVLQKTFRPQFSDFRLAIESAIFHIYQNTADSMARLNLENCGRKVFCNTVLGIFFPLEIRVHFGRP